MPSPRFSEDWQEENFQMQKKENSKNGSISETSFLFFLLLMVSNSFNLFAFFAKSIITPKKHYIKPEDYILPLDLVF